MAADPIRGLTKNGDVRTVALVGFDSQSFSAARTNLCVEKDAEFSIYSGKHLPLASMLLKS